MIEINLTDQKEAKQEQPRHVASPDAHKRHTRSLVNGNLAYSTGLCTRKRPTFSCGCPYPSSSTASCDPDHERAAPRRYTSGCRNGESVSKRERLKNGAYRSPYVPGAALNVSCLQDNHHRQVGRVQLQVRLRYADLRQDPHSEGHQDGQLLEMRASAR